MGKKKTHEEFLEDLKVKNPKAYEELEFLDEYKGSNKDKIRARDKYGVVLVRPDNLLNGTIPTILLAEDKHEYFLSLLKERNLEVFKEVKFIGRYKTSKGKILAESKYGNVWVIPHSVLSGTKIGISNAQNKTKYYINMAKENHSDFYDYSLVKYIKANSKIDIICPVHGVFKQSCSHHLFGSGCKKCGNLKSNFHRKKTTEGFISEAIKIHGSTYCYDLVRYISSHAKVKILCSKHGIFKQSPHTHLKGSGCLKCSKESSGFNRSLWVEKGINSKFFESYKLYKIKCFNESETFFKIGITYRDLESRFNHSSKMPYEYEIVEIIESDDGNYIYDLENELHKKYKEFSYKPKKSFKGDGECFSYIGID